MHMAAPRAIVFIAGMIALASCRGRQPVAAPAREVVAAKVSPGYRIVRREMELDIRSALEAGLDVEDTLELVEPTAGLARIVYQLPRIGPLFRFVVVGQNGGHGWSATTTPKAVDRALEAFSRWHAGEDVSEVARTVQFPGETNPILHPDSFAIVVRDASTSYTIEATGEKPVVVIRYSFGVTGRGFVERSVPGVPSATIKAFTRFELPDLDAGGGTQARLTTKVLAKATVAKDATGARAVNVLDERRHWKTSLVALPDGRQAVDVFSLEEGSFDVERSVQLQVDTSAGRQKLEVTSLDIVMPPPKLDYDSIFVDVAIDASADRTAWIEQAVRMLDALPGVSLASIYLGGPKPVDIQDTAGPLELPSVRGSVEQLVRLALAEPAGGPLLVFTDRPAEVARQLSRMRPGRVVHVIDIGARTPTGYRRVLGRTSPDAAAVERSGGILVELGTGGEPLESLWEHLATPRWIDDLTLTVDGAPFATDGALARVFNSSTLGSLRELPASAPLGTSFSSLLVRPAPAVAPKRWELGGLVWAKRVTLRVDTADGYLPIRKLRDSGALHQLAPDMRAAVEKELAKLGDVFPDAPQAWVAPIPSITRDELDKRSRQR